MRYPEGQPPDPTAPYGTMMHEMMTLSMWLGIVIGLCLYAAGRHGKVMWMKVWSLSLLGFSVAYLVGDAANLL